MATLADWMRANAQWKEYGEDLAAQLEQFTHERNEREASLIEEIKELRAEVRRLQKGTANHGAADEDRIAGATRRHVVDYGPPPGKRFTAGPFGFGKPARP